MLALLLFLQSLTNKASKQSLVMESIVFKPFPYLCFLNNMFLLEEEKKQQPISDLKSNIKQF